MLLKDILLFVSSRAMLHLFKAFAPVSTISLIQLLLERFVAPARLVWLLVGRVDAVDTNLYGIFGCHVTAADSSRSFGIYRSWILVDSCGAFLSARLASERLFQWVEESGRNKRHIFLILWFLLVRAVFFLLCLVSCIVSESVFISCLPSWVSCRALLEITIFRFLFNYSMLNSCHVSPNEP